MRGPRAGVAYLRPSFKTFAASAVLVAGACASSPRPTPTGTTSASSPTSPTAAMSTISTTRNDPPTIGTPTTDPGIPVAARVDSIEGAEEFVKYFMAQLDRSLTEPNSALLVPLCTPQSKTCRAYMDAAERFTSKGWRYVGRTFASTATLGQFWISGSATVLVQGSQPAGRIVDSTGTTVEKVPETDGGLVFELTMHGSWMVQSIKGEALPT